MILLKAVKKPQRFFKASIYLVFFQFSNIAY